MFNRMALMKVVSSELVSEYLSRVDIGLHWGEEESDLGTEQNPVVVVLCRECKTTYIRSSLCPHCGTPRLRVLRLIG